jgi:aminoglycoside phosphotransferase (APT) family kinase protein
MPSQPDSSDYQNYLKEKAAKVNTPRELIEGVIQQTLHANTQSIERIIHGEVNEVYRISTNQNQNLILRISQNTDERYAKERWAIEQSENAGVPVPKILSLTTLTTEQGPLTFCLENQIEGTPLDHIPGLDNTTKEKIINEAGTLLYHIHSVPTKGYGIINAAGVGEFATIQESLTEWSKKSERLYQVAKNIGLNSSLITKSLKILEDVAQGYTYTDSHLLHMDYSPKHFLVKDGTINGVIDFENAKAGDPLEEFARWDYYFDAEYPTQWLMDGYSDQSRFPTNSEQLIHAWRLHFGLGVADYYEEGNNSAGIKHTKEELLKDLEYFSNHESK